MKSRSKMILRSLVVLFAAALAVLSSAPATAQAATKYIVDDGNVNCLAGSGPANFTDIATAVTNAKVHNVHTILVCPGIYASSILISGFKTLTLAGAVPSDPPTLRPTAPANGGAIIHISNSSTGVTLNHLILDGSTFDPSTLPMMGVLVSDSSATVTNSKIISIRNSALDFSLDGIGVEAEGALPNKMNTLTVKQTFITNYQTIGILVRGRMKAKIDTTHIDGINGGTPDRVTGIIFQGTASGMPSGSINKSVIQGNHDSIDINEANKVSVTGNVLDGRVGVQISSDCSFHGATTTGNKVTGNTFLNLFITSVVDLNAMIDGSTVCNPLISGTAITNNTASTSSTGGTFGFNVHADDPSAGHSAHVAGTTITGNTLFGMCCVVNPSGPVTPPKVSNNVTVP